MPIPNDRRRLLGMSGAAVAAVAATSLLSACGGATSDTREVLAVEDLMREHGVLRRALLIYAEAADRLRTGQGEVDPTILGRTATLFRAFGEEYHERQLEEAYVFPAVVKAGGPAAALPAILKAQHDRGREITDYVTAVTRNGKIASADAVRFAGTLDGFVRMYQHHAALEDTLVFPAWKAAVSSKEYDELSDKFEDLETKMFGKDGFENAVKLIGDIESTFGLADLSKLTPPAPPKPAA